MTPRRRVHARRAHVCVQTAHADKWLPIAITIVAATSVPMLVQTVTPQHFAGPGMAGRLGHRSRPALAWLTESRSAVDWLNQPSGFHSLFFRARLRMGARASVGVGAVTDGSVTFNCTVGGIGAADAGVAAARYGPSKLE